MIKAYSLVFSILLSQVAFTQNIFQKNYLGTNTDIGYSLVTDATGYLLAGSSKSFGAGGSDILLIKTDLDGNQIWSKTIGGSANEAAFDAKKTTDGGFIICGYSSSYVYAPVDSSNMYVIKIDSVGNMQWSRSIGSFDKEVGKSIVQTFDGGYVCTGYTYSVGPGFQDIFLVKLNSAGTVLWSYGMGSTGDDVANCIVEKNDHTLWLAGSTTGYGIGGKLSYIVHTDPNGIPQSSTTYEIIIPSFAILNQFANYIMEGYNSDLIFAGSAGTYSSSINAASFYLIDIGNWAKTYSLNSGPGEVFSFDKTNDGGFIVGGIFPVLFKVDVLGQLQWTKFYWGGGYSGSGFSVKAANDGGYALLGYRGNASDTSVYLMKSGPTIGSGNCDQGSNNNTGFAPSLTIIGHTASYATSTMFIANDSGQVAIAYPFTNVICFTTGQDENTIDNSDKINISPNPTTDFITIHYNLSSPNQTTVSLFNLYGQKLKTSPLNPPEGDFSAHVPGKREVQLSLNEFPAGIYFVKVSDGEKEEVRKVVKY